MEIYTDVRQSETFNIGDIICASRNYLQGLHLFFQANDSDVADYSGKGRLYYILNDPTEWEFRYIL